MDAIDVLFDRLAGGLMLFVDNYFLSKASYDENTRFKIQPSYNVDYEISEEIIKELEKSCEGGIDEIWYHYISSCRNINDLPDYLQKLTILYLPKFFKQYPQYENHFCLQITSKIAE